MQFIIASNFLLPSILRVHILFLSSTKGILNIIEGISLSVLPPLIVNVSIFFLYASVRFGISLSLVWIISSHLFKKKVQSPSK